MGKTDDELVRGCQRYLDTLKERSEVLERQKAERRQADEQKAVKREYWRNLLYGDSKQGMTVIVPDKSVLNTKDSE